MNDLLKVLNKLAEVCTTAAEVLVAYPTDQTKVTRTALYLKEAGDETKKMLVEIQTAIDAAAAKKEAGNALDRPA